MARAGLDRGRIVTAALDHVDEVGLDGLSTRGLARRLGVQSPALYWHFRSKDELVAAMAEAMMKDLPDAQPAPIDTVANPAAVAAWLTERAQAFRRVLMSRRDGARIHAGSRPSTERLASVEAQLAMLLEVGFAPVAAARVTLAVSRFVVGWVLEEQATQHPDHDHNHDHDEPPDPAALPALAAALVVMDGADPDAEFTACLAAVVNGLTNHR